MNAKRVLLIVKLLIVAVVVGGGVLYFRPIPAAAGSVSLQASAQKTGAIPDLAWASYGGQAVSVPNESITATHGSEAPMPTASIAKLMTALGILQQHPLSLGQRGSTITLTDADVAIYQQDLAAGQSVVKVQSGEQVSEYQVLQAILLPSACNMANSAAIWAFGSMQNYLDFANHKAASLGMTNTHFAVDASGASAQTVSTPNDLLLLGQAVLKQPVLMEIVGQTKAEIPVAGTIYNYNVVLDEAGIDGLKTGNNNSDKGAFLFTAQYNSIRFLGVTMGAATLLQALHDSVTLLRSVQSNVTRTSFVKAGQQVGVYSSSWQKGVPVIASTDVNEATWKGGQPSIKVILSTQHGNVAGGTQVGSIVTNYNGKNASIPVMLNAPIHGPSFLWKLTHFR